MADYTPSASSQSSIDKMMARWKEDDRKLEVEARDREKRSMEMKNVGVVMLQEEDERIGVVLMDTENQSGSSGSSGAKEEGGETKTGGGGGGDKYVDPSMEDDDVVYRTRPLGMGRKLRPDDLIVRTMSREELSMCFAWMFQDEIDYPNNPNQWWTRARKGFMVGWEDGEERLTGGFVEVKKKK